MLIPSTFSTTAKTTLPQPHKNTILYYLLGEWTLIVSLADDCVMMMLLLIQPTQRHFLMVDVQT